MPRNAGVGACLFNSSHSSSQPWQSVWQVNLPARPIDRLLPACLPGCLAAIGWQDALAHSVVVCLFTACIIAQNLHKFLQNSRQQQEQHVVTCYIVSHVAASTTQANKQYYWKYVASATCCANICTCTRVFLKICLFLFRVYMCDYFSLKV